MPKQEIFEILNAEPQKQAGTWQLNIRYSTFCGSKAHFSDLKNRKLHKY